MARKTQRLYVSTQRLRSKATVALGSEEARPALPVTFKEGDRIVNGFEVTRMLAQQTGEADIYLCRKVAGTHGDVVIKLYRTTEGAKDQVLRQLKGIQHPDIIALLDYGDWENHFYETMEYARGGSLAERMPDQPFGEQELIETVIPEVANALGFCHKRNPKIIHRDLKPSNIFYRNADSTDIVIGDFGIASIMLADETHHATRLAMTHDYAAPESFFGDIGIETDYYALGITLIHLFSGYSPLSGMSEGQKTLKHISGKIPIPDGMSDRLKHLVQGLLIKEREDRWTAKEIRRWLTGEHIPIVETVGEKIQPIKLRGRREYRTLRELATAMQSEPVKFRADVGRSELSAALRPVDQKLAQQIETIENSNLEIDLKVLKIIYTLDPGCLFRLSPGRETLDLMELVGMIDRDEKGWQAGRELLDNGYLTIWLDAIGLESIVQKWRALDAKTREDKDRGLEAMLQMLDPDLPKPGLKVSKKKLAFGSVERNSSHKIGLEIENNGRGYLIGQARLQNAIDGVKLSGTKIRGKSTQVEVSLDTGGFPIGRRGRTNLIIETNAGRSLSIPVSYRVGLPLKRSATRLAFWVAVCALPMMIYRSAFFPRESALAQMLAPLVIFGAVVVALSRMLSKRGTAFSALLAFRREDFREGQRVVANLFGLIFPWLGAIFASNLFSPFFVENTEDIFSVLALFLAAIAGPAAGGILGAWLALVLSPNDDARRNKSVLSGFAKGVVVLFGISLILWIGLGLLEKYGVLALNEKAASIYMLNAIAALWGNHIYFANRR